ncbi:MAG: hypothetical protein ACLP22_03390 [Solirubrobacteraceae bacterium]
MRAGLRGCSSRGGRGVALQARIALCAVVGCVTPVLWVAIATAAAAASWTVQQTPNLAGAYSALDGVSCASPRSCTAVGFFTNRTGRELTLVEHSNGTSWSIPSTPNPAGATSSSFLGVSCASPRSCTAVGFFTNRTGRELTLAERWNGTSWSIQPTPNRVGATSSQLDAVSCSSPRSCIAVGLWFFINRASTEVTLSERWKGIGWSIQPTSSPASATKSGLDEVSCASRRYCTAVGFFANRAHTEVTTLAERWSGTSWSIQPTPNPAGTTISQLDAVSCSSPRSCTAVGRWFFINRANTSTTLAERYW